MKKLHNYKNGFTMIELVIVIAVLGILAALAIPRMQRDRTQEAADMILSNIRYTQHMAINDFKENPRDANWQKAFWQIQIESCANSSGMFLTIGSDLDYGGDIAKEEAALDPVNGKPMFWSNTQDCSDGGDDTVSHNVFLTKRFGVESIDTTGGCDGVKRIGFDHMGRPHVSFSDSDKPDYHSVMKETCTMTFKMKGDADDFSINIEPETGYAYIVNQNAS